jgi:hypothetical protein
MHGGGERFGAVVRAYYTAEQMQAYAATAADQEREACQHIADTVDTANDIAAAIRYRSATLSPTLIKGCNMNNPSASLIAAAAPDMLEALKAMVEEFRALDLPYGSKAYDKATSAINKANGCGVM